LAPARGHWKSGRWSAVEKSYNGATTFVIKTFSITTLSIMTLSKMGLFVTLSITPSSAVILSVAFLLLC
jgi:hypothetical protein